MATQRFYKPGSFYRIDARTGFAERAERTKREWTGQLVRDRSWEPRQPQDFVRGGVDNELAPDARPRLPEVFTLLGVTNVLTNVSFADGIGYFIIGLSGLEQTTLISVSNTDGWAVGDVVWIMQDNGEYWIATITDINGTDLTFEPSLVRPVSAGNQVVNISVQQRANNDESGAPPDFGPSG